MEALSFASRPKVCFSVVFQSYNFHTNNSEYEEMQVKHNKFFYYGVMGQINDNMFRPFF